MQAKASTRLWINPAKPELGHRLFKKGLGVISSEKEKDFRLTPEKEAEAFN